MRRVFALSALGLTFLITPALAENGPRVVSGVYPSPQAEPAAQSALGGGLVEFLLTGNAHNPPVRQARPAPLQSYEPRPALQAYAPRRQDAAVGLYAPQRPSYAALAPATEERPTHEIPAQFHRQEVDYPTSERPGSIIIDTPNKFLYLIEPGGRAMRYGVGVGRPGFEWAGVKTISRKAEWPDWTPPPEMMKRRPDLPAHMDGGPDNPLGARAMYLGSSMYRIHGTNEPWTIGQSVSSGCIRMMNEDVTDLYERVKVGTKVTVM